MITNIEGRTPSMAEMESFEKSDCFRLLYCAVAECSSSHLQKAMSDQRSDSERLRELAKASGVSELSGLWNALKAHVEVSHAVEERNNATNVE